MGSLPRSLGQILSQREEREGGEGEIEREGPPGRAWERGSEWERSCKVHWCVSRLSAVGRILPMDRVYGSERALTAGAVKPPLRQPALVSLIDMPEKDVDSGIGRAMQCESYIPHNNSMVQVSYGVLSPSWLARPPPRDANAPPPALPRVHSHTLRPRQWPVPKESVCGRALRKKVAMRGS